MKLENWEKIVYSWMNSWNFTETPIKDIDGLFDQKFYTALFKELGEETSLNMPESATYFLKDEYIGFNINSEIWSEQDSIIFTSLILYTASMKSHNLRTPLFNLPSSVQLSIQAFLQKLISKPAQDVNYDILLEIINNIDDTEDEVWSPGTPILRFQTLNFETPEYKKKERTKLKSLQCKLDLVEWEKQHLQEETEYLKNELETLKKKYDVKEHDVLKLESELYTRENDEDYETNNILKQAKTEEKRLKNRLIEMEQTMESMRTDLYRALTVKSTLESNLEISEERRDDCEKRCIELEEKVNMLTTHIQDLENLVYNLKQTNKEQSELLMEKMNNKSLNASIASFDYDGETLESVVEMKYLEAENTITILRAELQQSNDEKNELIKKLENMPNKTDFLYLKQQYQSNLDNMQDLKDENEYLKISLDKKKYDIEKLNKELEFKIENNELSSTDSGVNKSDMFLDGNEKLLDKISHLNSILDGKQLLLNETNSFVSQLKRELSSRDNDLTSLLEDLSLNKLKLNNKQQQICQLNKEIIDKVSEIENLQQNVSKYKSELSCFKNKLRTVELEAENLKGDLRVKETTILALEQNLNMNDHERSILERRINLLKIEADKVDLLKTELNNLKRDVAKLNQEIVIHKIEKEHLTVRLDEKEKNKNDFDLTFADLEKRMKKTHDLEIKHITEEYNVKINTLKKKMIKDKCHIEELSSELWEASDKYLLASQESSALRNQLQRTKATLDELKTNQRNHNYQEYDERLTYVRETWGSSAHRFPIDNDYHNTDEIFNDSCLEDLKAGVCRVSSAPLTTRASYPVLQTPDSSLSKINDRQSLIPFERPKKIKNTINYSRPGPPTPLKNRHSLQGLDRIEKIVKETEKITVTRESQPRRLSRFFKPNTKPKLPEPVSPKVKRKSFFMRTFGSNKENLPHN